MLFLYRSFDSLPGGRFHPEREPKGIPLISIGRSRLRATKLALLFIPLVWAAPAGAQTAPSYSAASLNGTYAAIQYNHDSSATQSNTPAQGTPLPAPLGFHSNVGTVSFDGAGNGSISFTQNVDGVVSPNPDTSFTYTVSSTGAFATGDNTGYVLDNGKIVIASSITAGQNPQILVLVRVEGHSDNTSTGANALGTGTTGVENTADGAYSMAANTTGYGNVAAGYQSLLANTTGYNNTAYGLQALMSNIGGYGNAAQGTYALQYNTTGHQNMAVGNQALKNNTTGNQNIALGFQAGLNLTTGSDNIYVANPGGAAAESGTIRIGAQGTQTAAYVQGIYGVSVSGNPVYVASNGQLGVVVSSERYKTEVASMGEATRKLDELRPVTFKLKTDASGTRQYGLIAEEVARVYPELVIRDADGRIDGVRYEELAPMLLNRAQEQERTIAALRLELRALGEQVADVRRLAAARPAQP
jgi:hypothetical protein